MSEDKEVYADEAFDLALAKAKPEHVPVVCNDFHLQNKERIMVVSVPTRAKRPLLVLLGSLLSGQPGVAGTRQTRKLFLFDHLFTHFEQEEDIKTAR